MSIETSARLALKNLNLDEKVVGSNKEKTTTTKNPELSVANAGSFKPAAKTKMRRKKVTWVMGKEYLEKHPPPLPSPRIATKCWILNDLQDRVFARKKAEREEWESIIKQYKDHGYAEKEVEVTNDEEDEEEL